MTDMEKVLKRKLCQFKKVDETCKQFCCNTIILTAETFVRVSKGQTESKCNMIDKIYKVEVVIDGQSVFEHYGKNSVEMNNQYLIALEMCKG